MSMIVRPWLAISSFISFPDLVSLKPVMRVLFISFCFLIVHAKIQGQVADTIQLTPVSISESRSSIFTIGNFVTEIDSSILKNAAGQNLGEVLSSASTVFIKSNGSGGSATISSRGTEARHSAILWNGFNINSSTLGLTDLSLVPSLITENIRIVHGGSSPVNGNSAIGSVISLEQSQPHFENQSQLSAYIDYGSFNNERITIGAKFGTKFLESKTVIFANSANNDFEYENIAKRDQPVEKLQHSSYENIGFSQDFHFKIKSNQILSVALWYQVNHREIPAMMTIPESFAEQRDSNQRIYLGYKINFKKSILKVSVGHFREHQFYVDPEFELDLKYDVSSYLSEAEWRLLISDKLIISNGVTYTKSLAGFDEYKGDESRDIASVYSNTFYEPIRGLKINAGLRKEFTNVDSPPLSPSLGVEANLYKNIVLLTANTGFHYSIPSMNDLYWVPGGNPGLKPEEAWSNEAGFILFRNHLKIPSLAFTFYRSVVDNWIKWQPGPAGVYTPDNLRQVTASGFELSMNYKKTIKSFSFSGNLNYAYTSSILTESTNPGSEDIIDKQLIYIPENIFNAVLHFQYKSFSLQFNHTFTGIRYTTADNLRYLEGYNVADLIINNCFKIKKNQLDVFFKIMNIYDSSYHVLAYRPTPGRWFSGGIKFNLNLTK